MITNYPSFISFIIGVACLAVYVLFFTPRQLQEVASPRDGFTRLRWVILSILVVSILTAIPGTVYQFYRSFGHEYPVLRSVATISTQISKLATTFLLVLVFTYKLGDK